MQNPAPKKLLWLAPMAVTRRLSQLSTDFAESLSLTRAAPLTLLGGLCCVHSSLSSLNTQKASQVSKFRVLCGIPVFKPVQNSASEWLNDL